MAATTNSTNLKSERAKEGLVIDGHDYELIQESVQLISLNQEENNLRGHYLAMNPETLKVTADGSQEDRETTWKAHFTLDENRCQVVTLENDECSAHLGKRCVLQTKKDEETGHYVLGVKEVENIPTRLELLDPSIKFYKKPRATGSEHVYLESALGTENNRLLVGFDSEGKPLPLDEVEEHSKFYEPYFKVIPYRPW